MRERAPARAKAVRVGKRRVRQCIARASATSGRSVSGHAENSERTGAKSETTHRSVGIRSTRLQTRVGVSSGSREDIVFRRKRAHGVVVYDDEPVHRVIIKKRRNPNVAIVGETSRIVTRSHVGSGVNVSTSVHGHETTSWSATTVNRSESSASGTSRGSLHSQSGGQTRATGGSAGSTSGGNSRSTTGQGTSR
jgi:hypothetical protein